jgi:hypothetical protein
MWKLSQMYQYDYGYQIQTSINATDNVFQGVDADLSFVVPWDYFFRVMAGVDIGNGVLCPFYTDFTHLGRVVSFVESDTSWSYDWDRSGPTVSVTSAVPFEDESSYVVELFGIEPLAGVVSTSMYITEATTFGRPFTFHYGGRQNVSTQSQTLYLWGGFRTSDKAGIPGTIWYDTDYTSSINPNPDDPQPLVPMETINS